MAEIKAEPKVQEHKGGSVAGTFASLLKRGDTSVILATLVLFLIFALGNDSFLTPFNMFNVSRTAALYVFVAMGQAKTGSPLHLYLSFLLGFGKRREYTTGHAAISTFFCAATEISLTQAFSERASISNLLHLDQ